MTETAKSATGNQAIHTIRLLACFLYFHVSVGDANFIRKSCKMYMGYNNFGSFKIFSFSGDW